MSDPAIRVANLGKLYRIRQRQGYDTLRDMIAGSLVAWVRRGTKNGEQRQAARDHGPASLEGDAQYIWAIKDVSFEVQQGEVVGIIGRNGAGKSTLLKILSRITEPSQGYVEVHGRIGSLLEVGTGFHPELTGRENIYLNGAILGMKKREIRRKFDEIVAFAEVERFIDTPVKHYSSGMYVRLAFAVAAHLDPEILLVDEVLAVGDAPFQRKCLAKMQDAANEGRTILFISHNAESVQRLCQRCLWLGEGKLLMDREADVVVSEYVRQAYGERNSCYVLPKVEDAPAGQQAVLLQAEILGSNGMCRDHLRFGESFTIGMRWEHFSEIPGISYSIRVYDEYSRLLYAVNTIASSMPLEHQGTHEVRCKFEPSILVPGVYYFSIGAYVRPSTTIHVMERCLRLIVTSTPYHPAYPFNIVGQPLVAVRPEWSQGS